MAKKMDRKLVAVAQQHELAFLKKRYGVPYFVTRAVVAMVGRGKAAVYEELRQKGYDMPKKRTTKKARG